MATENRLSTTLPGGGKMKKCKAFISFLTQFLKIFLIAFPREQLMLFKGSLLSWHSQKIRNDMSYNARGQFTNDGMGR